MRSWAATRWVPAPAIRDVSAPGWLPTLGGAAGRLALWGLITFVIGQTLTTAVFGVAAFFQPAIGDAFLAGNEAVARSVNEDVYGPALFATVGVGLVLWMFGVIQLGRAIHRGA